MYDLFEEIQKAGDAVEYVPGIIRVREALGLAVGELIPESELINFLAEMHLPGLAIIEILKILEEQNLLDSEN